MLRWLIDRADQDEVRLPILHSNYESSVKGLHIVGDLAGAPTIRAAANQGVEVMEHIGSLPDGARRQERRRLRRGHHWWWVVGHRRGDGKRSAART